MSNYSESSIVSEAVSKELVSQGEVLQKKKGRRRNFFEDHVFNSYFVLRGWIGWLAIAFPIVLVGGGLLIGVEGGVKASMSAYYWAHAADGKATGDLFVGILWAIGVFLILYTGWDIKEDWALNLAGLFAICVALFPTTPPKSNSIPESGALFPDWILQSREILGIEFTIHGFSAVALFLCMAFVCLVCASSTLDKIKNPKTRCRYERIYFLLGLAMIAVPIAATVLNAMLTDGKHWILIAEGLGVWVFGGYWLVKNLELSGSGYEKKKATAPPPVQQLRKLYPGESIPVQVDPREHHYPTGVVVGANERYAFSAEGKWKDLFITCGAEGWPESGRWAWFRRWNPMNIFARKHFKPMFLLCGNVGEDDRTKFPIGAAELGWSVPQKLPEDRQLYLFANDWRIAYCNNKQVEDNPLTVTITCLENENEG